MRFESQHLGLPERLKMYCFRFPRGSSERMISKRRRSQVDTNFQHEAMEIISYSGEICPKRQANEQAEHQRARNSFKVLQDSILNPDDEEEDYSIFLCRRPVSPEDYSLAIDFTAEKMLIAVIEKCKIVQCFVGSIYKEQIRELLSTLENLHEILQTILGSPFLSTYQNVLEDIMLYSTKAYTFLEKLCHELLPASKHGVQKSMMKMNEFSCHFYNQTVRLSEECKTSDDDPKHATPKNQRLSFGVTTFRVPLHNVALRLLKKKRVQIAVRDLDSTCGYNVELSYPRGWFSKDVALSSKIESNDRGFSQTLHANRVNIEKGSWGWEEAQDTVLITYDDLVVANVASESGNLLTYNRGSPSCHSFSSNEDLEACKYKISIQIVGSSRIDLDLQSLYIKGMKEKDKVYYKCFLNTSGREEVLGIYRYQQKQFRREEGILHIVGRGNQPGLRHVLVSIFSSLGFTSIV